MLIFFSRWSLFYQQCYKQEGRESKRLLRLICSEYTVLPHVHLLYPFQCDPCWCKSYHFFSPLLLLEVILFCVFPVYSFLFCSSVPCFSTLILVRLLGFLMLHSIYHLFYIVPAPRSPPSTFPYIRSAFIITHTSSLTRFFTLIRHLLRSCVSCKLPRQFPPQTLLHQNAQTGVSGLSRISRTE